MSQFRPDGIYKIFCNHKWARNSPGEPYVVLSNKEAPIPDFEKWQIDDVPGGYTIQNVATGLYVHANGFIEGEPLRLDNEPTVWVIQGGGGSYLISLPHNGPFWTSVLDYESNENHFALMSGHSAPYDQEIQLVKV